MLDQHLFGLVESQEAMLAEQRAAITSMSARLDLFQEIEDRQDTAQTELDSRLLDIEAFYGLAA